jgi:CNT family concentrative nucleoside transporter
MEVPLQQPTTSNQKRSNEMIFQSIAGLLIFAAVAWLMGENRKQAKLKVAVIGIVLQLIVGLILLKLPIFREFFLLLNRLVLSLEEATSAGTSFVFGYLGGGDLPFQESFPGASFILAFRGLPLVLLMSALSALLFYWKILPLIVKAFSWALQKTMKLGGAEGLGVSANIFVGMSILKNTIPDVMGHILTASIISVPAAITVSKLMVPETGELTSGEMRAPEKATSSMDAVTKGTLQGVELLLNIIAMLVVLVALVYLLNLILGLLPQIGAKPVTLQRLLGYVMAPVVWFMGVPWQEATTAGGLMGTKTILNELLAYLELSQLEPGTLSPRSSLIMIYAMCGFANPGSLGIMIGGMGTMAPGRRDEIVALGLRSIIAGTLATCMTGAVVGIIGG